MSMEGAYNSSNESHGLANIRQGTDRFPINSNEVGLKVAFLGGNLGMVNKGTLNVNENRQHI